MMQVGIAKKLGIVYGQGEDLFNPQAKITRQDMMVLTERDLKSAQLSSPMTEAVLLESYLDKGAIANLCV